MNFWFGVDVAAMQKKYLILALLLLLTVIRGLIYISIFPPWLTPDEPAHFEAIRILGQLSLRPTAEVQQNTPMLAEMPDTFADFRIWEISRRFRPDGHDPSGQLTATFPDYYPAASMGGIVAAGHYPLLYHSALSILSSAIKSADIVTQVYILRLVSLIWVVLTIALSWFFARTIFPDSLGYSLAVSSFILFLPMQMHVNTGISTDAPAMFIASLFFLLIAKIMMRPLSWPFLLAALATMLLAVLIKPTTLFIGPTFGVAILILLARKMNWPGKFLGAAIAIVSLLVMVGSVIMFQVSSGGRGLAMLLFSPGLINLAVFIPNQQSIEIYIHTLRWGFLAFWGLFGWVTIYSPFNWIRVLWVLCALMGTGFVVFIWRNIIKPGASALTASQQNVFVVLAVGVIFALMGMYAPIIATQSLVWGPPGRYFFPALLPAAMVLFAGFKQLFPARLASLALPLWVTVWVTYDTAVILSVLLPEIYG